MKLKEGFVQAYNGQIAVDAHAQVIVAQDVTQSPVDYGQLLGMADAVEANLGRKPAEASADSGYCSEANLAGLEEREIDAYVATGRVKDALPVRPRTRPKTRRHRPWPTLPRRGVLRRRPRPRRGSRPCVQRLRRAATTAPIGCASRWSSRCSGRSSRPAASASSCCGACRSQDRGWSPARRPSRPFLPEREVLTGIVPVAVRQQRVRDRKVAADAAERIRFTPSILPPYIRRSKSIETLLPILYLKGISTGNFSEALAALLGADAGGLSASAIGRLRDGWQDDHAASQKRDLSARRYVYVWADGIHPQARLEDEKQCILVLIGTTPEGRKELVGFTDGASESASDWRGLLLDLKRRGLDVRPELAIADGALGFW